LKIRISHLAIAVTALFACAAIAPAAPPKKGTTKAKTAHAKTKSKAPAAKPVGKPSNAEVGLVGIKLYDPGTRLISLYGSPSDIQPINIGGTAVGGGGSGPGAGAGPMGAGMAPMGGGGPRGGPAAPSPVGSTGMLDGFDDPLFFAPPPAGRSPAGAPPMGGGPSGGPAAGPASSGVPAGGGGMGPAAGGGGGSSDGRVIYTRWVYKRGGSRYGFILNKDNKVVQIEAIGLADSKVRTKKGIGFGAGFGTIIRKYGAPDAYEISGNSIVVRYLVRNKVAFRLSRLGMDKPHVVTGVVVAAGKS
jgi:hypothetical protein